MRSNDPFGWDELRIPLAVTGSLGSAVGAILLSATIGSDLWARILLPTGLLGFLLPLWLATVPRQERNARTATVAISLLAVMVALEAVFANHDVSGLGVMLGGVTVLALYARRLRRRHSQRRRRGAPVRPRATRSD